MNNATRPGTRRSCLLAAVLVAIALAGCKKGAEAPTPPPRPIGKLPRIMTGVPADTIFVTAATNLDGFRAAMQGTALAAAWNDPRLQTWRQQSWPKWKSLFNQMAPVSLEEIDGLLHGDYLYLGKLAETDSGGTREVTAVLARPSTNRGQLEAFVEKINAGGNLVVKWSNDVMIVSRDENLVTEIDNALRTGRSPMAGGGEKAFNVLEKNFDTEAFFHFWVDLQAAAQQARQIPAASMLGPLGVQTDILGLNNLLAFYGTWAPHQEGFRSTVRVQCDIARHGILGMTGDPAPSRAIRYVPADTRAFFSIRHAGVEKALSLVRAAASPPGQEISDEQWQGQLAGMNMMLGVDVQNELPGMIGREIAFAIGPGLLTLLIESPDPPKLLELLERLMMMQQARSTTTQYQNVSYKYVDSPLPLPIPLPVQVSYGRVGNFAVVSLQQTGLRAVIDAQQSGRSLGDDPDYRRAIAMVGEAGWFERVSKLDENTGTKLLEVSPMLIGGINSFTGGSLTPNDVPDFQVFADHMKPGVTRGRAEPDALVFEGYSTGGEIFQAASLAAWIFSLIGGGPIQPGTMPPSGVEMPAGTAGPGLGGLTEVGQAKAAQEAMARAIERFFVENRRYPGFDVGAGSYNGSLGSGVPAASLPSLDNSLLRDSPYAAAGRYPVDPFCPEGKATFVYWSIQPGQPDPSGKIVSGDTWPGWILVSPGPDGDYDIAGEWDVYDPKTAPSDRLLTGTNQDGSAFTYDPTNGTTSNGDIWRVKQ